MPEVVLDVPIDLPSNWWLFALGIGAYLLSRKRKDPNGSGDAGNGWFHDADDGDGGD